MFLFLKKYFQFIFIKWKLISFILATVLISSVSKFAHDPTWDIGVSVLMSILTYLTSPFAVKSIYDGIITKKITQSLVVSFIFIYLSSVGSYDFYNYVLYGFIPESNIENVFISVPIYLLAGIFWNLETGNNGKILSLKNKDWPSGGKILIYSKAWWLSIFLSGLVFLSFVYFIF